MLGAGKFTYDVVESWGRLPAGKSYGYTHGVVVDSQDRVYIFNQSTDAVACFEADGTFLHSWGEAFAAGAHGMYLSVENGAEYLYLTDLERHLVVKTTLDGQTIWEMGPPDRPDLYSSRELYQPTDVCVAPNADFYVCDGYGENWIHQYNAGAEYVRSWGGKGEAPGQLDCPHGVWVDTRGEEPVLLVADRGNKRIQTFTLDGKHAGFVKDELRLPCCFYQSEGELYIPDLLARVTIFDRDNRLITHLGDNLGIWQDKAWPNVPSEALQPGKFVAPHAVCVDSRGDLYVAEWYERGRVTKLARKA